MSAAALASSRNRRAGTSNSSLASSSNGKLNSSSTPSQSSSSPSSGGGGLTLPQVIMVIDQRLTALEKQSKLVSSQEKTDTLAAEINIEEIFQEFQTRTNTLAEEVSELKNAILKLQTFTMDINKQLVSDYVTNSVKGKMESGEGLR